MIIDFLFWFDPLFDPCQLLPVIEPKTVFKTTLLLFSFVKTELIFHFIFLFTSLVIRIRMKHVLSVFFRLGIELYFTRNLKLLTEFPV